MKIITATKFKIMCEKLAQLLRFSEFSLHEEYPVQLASSSYFIQRIVFI